MIIPLGGGETKPDLVVCFPPPGKIPGSLPVSCADCSTALVISPATNELLLSREHALVVCGGCASARVEREQEEAAVPAVLKPTPGQILELVELLELVESHEISPGEMAAKLGVEVPVSDRAVLHSLELMKEEEMDDKAAAACSAAIAQRHLAMAAVNLTDEGRDQLWRAILAAALRDVEAMREFSKVARAEKHAKQQAPRSPAGSEPSSN